MHTRTDLARSVRPRTLVAACATLGLAAMTALADAPRYRLVVPGSAA